MCGIFGYIGPRSDAAKIVLDGLKSLEYRGYDSWGVAIIPKLDVILASEHRARPGSKNDSGHTFVSLSTRARMTEKIVIKKRVGKIRDATVADMPKSSFAFGHTRWATHGGVTEINAHPHLDCTKTIAVVHNGIIENYEELKKELLDQGHQFVSQTDTEVAAHLIEEFGKTLPFFKAVRQAFNKLAGLNAIIAIDSNNRQLVAAKNGSPLVVGFGKKENYLASDAAALLPHTRTIQFLEDGKMAIVEDTNIRIQDVKTGKAKSIKKQTLDWTIAQSEKGDYPFFMLKEIYEQPDVLTSIAGNVSQARKLAKIIKKSYGTYMVGCGTAGYACLAGAYLFSKIAKRHVNWAIGSEFGYHLDFLTPKSLVIALSQSGETMDILESVKKAKEKGAKIAALTNVLGSTLYRLSDYKLLVGAGPEKSVASTKDFTGKLGHLILLSYALAGNIDEGQKVLKQAIVSSKKILNDTRTIEKLAHTIKDNEHVFVIGRGLSYPASLETALKIKEISYIHAEGLAAGELKHGPLALVEKGVPCIAFLPNDETYGANLAGAMEMKARGGMIIGISHKPHEVFDQYIEVADAREGTIIPNVIVAQLLAYYLSVEKGLDPDKPRNLAKSVTVK